MKLKDLKKPFPAEDIEWRIGRCGKKGEKVWAMALAYITARAIHDRLDEVCGESNWQLVYKEHLGETICGIGVFCGNGWIWKYGGAGKTDFEAFKGGLSSAEKRAGVPWGIGRYLYNLTETFVETSLQKKDGWNYQSANKKKDIPAFWWKTPQLPAWALPQNTPEPKQPEKKDEIDYATPWTPEQQKDFINVCQEKGLTATERDQLKQYLVERASKKVGAHLKNVPQVVAEYAISNFDKVYSEYTESKL